MSTTVPDDAEALAHVHKLYDLHAECHTALRKRSWNNDFKREMTKKLRELSRVLRVVRQSFLDYLGGDDVLPAIEEVRTEVRRRIEVIPQ